MAVSIRLERVAAELQAAVSEVLIGGLKDPRYRPVTITAMEVSPDLRHADVRFMPLGGGPADELAEVLNAARGYIQRKVARRVRMKYLPVLRFHVDVQSEEALEMNRLLDQLAAERREK